MLADKQMQVKANLLLAGQVVQDGEATCLFDTHQNFDYDRKQGAKLKKTHAIAAEAALHLATLLVPELVKLITKLNTGSCHRSQALTHRGPE